MQDHEYRDRWLDVHTYSRFGDRVFVLSDIPVARIPPSDILSIFPLTDEPRIPAKGMLELSPRAFAEFMELSGRNQLQYERLWTSRNPELR
jgi:hypothetical protein